MALPGQPPLQNGQMMVPGMSTYMRSTNGMEMNNRATTGHHQRPRAAAGVQSIRLPLPLQQYIPPSRSVRIIQIKMTSFAFIFIHFSILKVDWLNIVKRLNTD